MVDLTNKMMNKRILVEFLAEFLGMFVFICFGLGSVAQSVLYGNQISFVVSLAFSFGITFGIIIAGNISGIRPCSFLKISAFKNFFDFIGGHLNPAVSLAFLLNGQIKFIKFLVLIAAQLLGAFLSALFIFMIYQEALVNKVGSVRDVSGINGTARIWVTYPANDISIVSLINRLLIKTNN